MAEELLTPLGRMRTMHLKQSWLSWIEKRLPLLEQRQVQAHLDQCPECAAEISEMQDLVGALEAMPAALAALPWQKERLWPAIRAGLRVTPAALRPARWAAWVSTAALLVVFGGAWWASLSNVAPAATAEASYIALPPATPHLPLILPQQTLAGNDLPCPALPRSTPQPLPAPAQTPVFAGTSAPGG